MQPVYQQGRITQGGLRQEAVEPKKRLGKAEAFVVFRYVYVGYYPRLFIK